MFQLWHFEKKQIVYFPVLEAGRARNTVHLLQYRAFIGRNRRLDRGAERSNSLGKRLRLQIKRRCVTRWHMSRRRAICLVRVECDFLVFNASVGAIEDRFQFGQISSGEKPWAIVRRRQCEWSRGDHFNLVMLVLKLFMLRARIFFQEGRSPFTDPSVRVFGASPEAEAACKFRIVTIDRSQREKGIFWTELFEIQQSLRSHVFLWDFRQRLAKKILHGWFAGEQIKIGMMPLIARSVEVRQVRQKNRFAWKKHADRPARSFLRNAPGVPDNDCDGRAGDHKERDSSHEK